MPYTQSLGGILRVYSFINSLKKKHKVYLLVSKSLKNKKYGYLGIKKKDLKSINLFYIRNNSSKLILSIFNFKIFRNLFYLLGIDYALNINKEFLKTSSQIIKKNKIDYVIISSPPFSLFYLVKKIRLRFKKIKIILDYRDGWSTRIDNFFIYPIKLIIKNYIEKNILKNSDFVIAATNKIRTKLNFLTKNQSKLLLLRNGFFYRPTKIKKKNKKIKIGYFGLISEDRSSYRNIRIIYDVIKNNKYLQKKIIFEFYGNNEIKDKDIKNFKSFKFKDNLNYKKALSKMTQMDYLLVLHTEKSTSEEMVTSKFYDYLASSTPILNISSGPNEVGQIIKKLNLGYNVDYENNNLEKFLLELKRRKKIKWKKKFDIYSRHYQNKKLQNIIK